MAVQSDNRTFTTEREAEAALDRFYRAYPPQGYGSRGLIFPNGQGGYVLTTTRHTSCD